VTRALAALDGSTGVVTGASGFIGRTFLAALPPDVRVHAVYHGAEDFPGWAAGCRADVRPLRLDLRREALADHVGSADWALLLAARVQTARSWDDPIGELEAIAGVTVNGVRGLRTAQVVHLSSGSVYERLEGALSPDRVLAPRLPYSVAKLTAELLLGTYAGARYWNVRFFGAFGPGEPPFKLARRLVDAFARGDTVFTISGDGSNRIDPMYVDVLGEALAALVVAPAESRAVDLCQGEGLTVRRFAEIAYANAHPSPDGRPLVLRTGGEAHEQMRGIARAGAHPAVAGARIPIAEGFRRYASALAQAARHVGGDAS
jgi:nucleoside-diphosphate-sugar epimerase